MLSILQSWHQSIGSMISSLGWPMEAVLRLVIAGVFGGAMGLEREIRGRRAGFRTYLLVCMGSALVMIVSIEFAVHRWRPQTLNQGVNINVDPSRIAYGVMVGIGFLGAGTINNTRGLVQGLTTAAGLWCSAAIGLATGFGMYSLALAATVLVLLALWGLEYIEFILPRSRYRIITVRAKYQPGCLTAAVDFVAAQKLRVLDASFQREPDLVHVQIDLRVSFKRGLAYDELERRLESDPRYELLKTSESVS